MSKSLQAFQSLRKNLLAGQLAPVYVLYGEEDYFLDQLSDLIEQKALEGGEPSFNSDIVYGSELKGGPFVGAARSYPVMAPRRLAMVKEANRARKEQLEALEGYLKEPAQSTVLALVFRSKSGPDKRSKLGKLLHEKGVVFEAKPLYDNQVPQAIDLLVQGHQAEIDSDALRLLTASLGTSLGRIDQELQKVLLNLPEQGERRITRELVYEYVDIDKDYNVFELVNQVGARNVARAHHVLDQLLANVKANPPILILAQLNTLFTRLAQLKQQGISQERDIASALRIPPFFAKDYRQALGRYPMGKLAQNLKHLLRADLELKGIGGSRLDEGHVLRTLLYNLMQA